ncbi:MarR family transcriptional regulator [Exiguobacterium marinum]|uniref:MarR family transcriptional regulator n=1 Tax=Exiguobacterium marinum TaxID=273528 RepID=UPI00047A53AB|nr:hypothetical protein [Exiguobacterium marinum]
MSIHIAVVGSPAFIQQVRKGSSSLPDVRIEGFPYDDPREAKDIATQLLFFDGVFFSGSFPYTYATEEATLPYAHHVVQDDVVLLTSLLYVTLTQQLRIENLSIDLVDTSRLESILTSFPSHMSPSQVKELSPYMNFEELIAFHEQLQQNGTTRFALTSVERVHRHLVENGFASQLMIEPKERILHHFHNFIQQIRLNKSDQSQFAVLCYSDASKDTLNHVRKHHCFGGKFMGTAQDSIVLLSNKGKIESAISNGFILSEDTPGHVGIGYGSDYQRAFDHAELALHTTSDATIRIVDDSKRMTFTDQPAPIHFRVTQTRVYDMMKQTGMSPTNIEKLIHFSTDHLEFTAKELTDHLNVTRRTTERLIKKLVDAKLVHRIGEEMSYSQGRPRTVYKFQFPVD